MPIHIDKSSALLRDEIGVDQPVLAAAYLKIEPIPEEWASLVEDAGNKPVDVSEIRDAPKELRMLVEYAEATAKISAIELDEGLLSKCVARAKCLEVFIFLAGYLADMFKPEIKEELKALYKQINRPATRVNQLMRSIYSTLEKTNEALKRLTMGLKGATVHIFRTDDSMQSQAEARLGILRSWMEFHSRFTIAQNRHLTMEQRTQTLEKAVRQLSHIAKNVHEPRDVKMFHLYLSLRVGPEHLLDAEASAPGKVGKYNDLIQEIIKLRGDLDNDEDL